MITVITGARISLLAFFAKPGIDLQQVFVVFDDLEPADRDGNPAAPRERIHRCVKSKVRN